MGAKRIFFFGKTCTTTFEKRKSDKSCQESLNATQWDRSNAKPKDAKGKKRAADRVRKEVKEGKYSKKRGSKQPRLWGFESVGVIVVTRISEGVSIEEDLGGREMIWSPMTDLVVNPSRTRQKKGKRRKENGGLVGVAARIRATLAADLVCEKRASFSRGGVEAGGPITKTKKKEGKRDSEPKDCKETGSPSTNDPEQLNTRKKQKPPKER